jgi:hypothetical protein
LPPPRRRRNAISAGLDTALTFARDINEARQRCRVAHVCASAASRADALSSRVAAPQRVVLRTRPDVMLKLRKARCTGLSRRRGLLVASRLAPLLTACGALTPFSARRWWPSRS